MKLVDLLMKGYATVHGQCSQEVKDKLKESDAWERIQSGQTLHELMQKIKRIRVGFDDHKQEIFNLVQSLRLLFIYTQIKEHRKKHIRLLSQPPCSILFLAKTEKKLC
jgi:hypothetical protein